jgi:hypothetical protein
MSVEAPFVPFSGQKNRDFPKKYGKANGMIFASRLAKEK